MIFHCKFCQLKVVATHSFAQKIASVALVQRVTPTFPSDHKWLPSHQPR